MPQQVGSEGQVVRAKEATTSMSKARIKGVGIKRISGRKSPIFGKSKVDEKQKRDAPIHKIGDLEVLSLQNLHLIIPRILMHHLVI